MTPTVTVRDGHIFWHGVYRLRDEAERLASHFEGLDKDDWFWATAADLAAQLREAIRETAQ